MQSENRNRKQIKKHAKYLAQARGHCQEFETLYMAEAQRNADLREEVSKLRKQNELALQQNQNLLEDFGRTKAENARLSESLLKAKKDFAAIGQIKQDLRRELREEQMCANVAVHQLSDFSYAGVGYRKSQNRVSEVGTIFEKRLEGRADLKGELLKLRQEKGLWEQLAKQSRELRANDLQKLRQTLVRILYYKNKLVDKRGELDREQVKKLNRFIQQSINYFN